MKDVENLPENFIDNIHIIIGKNVKRIRKEKDISQLKLSYAMGYKSVSTLSCAEIYHKKIHFPSLSLHLIQTTIYKQIIKNFCSNCHYSDYFSNF